MATWNEALNTKIISDNGQNPLRRQPGLLEQLSQGLRGVAGIYSPSVYEAHRREDLQAQQQQFQAEQLQRQEQQQQRRAYIDILTRAVENGSVRPESAQQLAQRLGLDIPSIGPSAQTQRAQADILNQEQDEQVDRALYQQSYGKPVADIGQDGQITINEQEVTTTPVTVGDQAMLDKQISYAQSLVNSGRKNLVDRGLKILADLRAEEKAGKQTETNLGKLIRERDSLPVDSPLRATYDEAISRESQGTTRDSAFEQRVSALTESLTSDGFQNAQTLAKGIAAGRYVASQNPINGQKEVVDLATGRVVGQKSGGGYGSSQPRGTAVDPSIQPDAGTGASGFFGNIANTIKDAFGFGLASPQVEQAKNALENLKVQTITLMQEAVPGRPSVALMKELEKLTINPGSLFQGDQRSYMRLKQTRDMLRTEVQRMERDVLGRAQNFRPEQVTVTRLNHDQLAQLLREYDVIIAGFERGFNTKDVPMEQFFRKKK